jgi:hypothetical protein
MPSVVKIARKYAGVALPSRPVLTGLANMGGAQLGNERLSAGRPCMLNVLRDRDGASGALNGTISVWGTDLGNPDMSVGLSGGAGYPSSTPGFTPLAQRFTGDGASVNYDSILPFVAVSNYNWILLIFRQDRPTKTGTATTTVGSADVTGAGTAFDTEFYEGAIIIINGEAQTVREVTSSTRLSTEQAWTGANAGAAITGSVYPVPAYTTDYTVVTNAGLARVTLVAASRAPAGSRMELHFVKPVQILADAAHPFESTQIRARTIMWILSAGGSTSATDALLEPLT